VTLVDTSVWVDHFRSIDALLVDLMSREEAMVHPFVIGELAIGHLRARNAILAELRKLPSALVARDHEVVELIDRHRLFGTGIGYIDAHLLAAALATGDVSFWTRDRRLLAAAIRLGIAAHPVHQASRHLTMRSGV
jgi:predicted nucleic acid-binding protein